MQKKYARNVQDVKNAYQLHFKRYEFKYHLPVNFADKIIPELLNYMAFDPNVVDSGNFYEVHSIYFDSPHLKNYYEKTEGQLFRKKLRIRTYTRDVQDSTPVFLEIKRKHNMVILKDRSRMTFSLADKIIGGAISRRSADVEHIDSDLLDEFLQEKILYAMRPKVLVSYKRQPLVSHNGMNLRVTFDYDISSAAVSSLDFSKDVKPLYPGMLVMEVKFNDLLPYWLHEVIQKYKLEAWPYSKYCAGVESRFDYQMSQYS